MTRVHRRNFLPAVIVDLVLWISCGLIVFLFDPDKDSQLSVGSLQFDIYPNIILFFVIFGLSLTITLALLFGNTRRGLFASLFLVSLLLLRLFKYFYWWSALILLAFALAGEILLSIRSRKKQSDKTVF